MYQDTVDSFVAAGHRKLVHLRQAPQGFFISSMLAGAYIGVAILLIFTLGAQAPVEFRKLVMGAAFGLALILVVVAGAELFTGHTMIMSLRRYAGHGTWREVAGQHPDTVSVAGMVWNLGWVTLGNIVGGAVFVAGAYWAAASTARKVGKTGQADPTVSVLPTTRS
ncbi:MAG: formate/nitrite transporter family protein [Burkholderiaceae bacterium]